MIHHTVQIRVRYAETDKMGYVYYGNYASYLEVARVETFRAIGYSYKTLEDEGTMMPVSEYKIKYLKPAFYDDLLTVHVYIKNKPGVRIVFEYEIYNEQNTLLSVAETVLVFIKSSNGKPCLPPESFQKILNAYFEQQT
ncbi:MAG: acyl-CoA thioesterase [Cytophagaceae bacterium]|nr:acyl-CoA thioesterase [Cytophagaceae bacterium]MDW8456230.1 thioesterase family protein [Cytophagaceae bacterium]